MQASWKVARAFCRFREEAIKIPVIDHGEIKVALDRVAQIDPSRTKNVRITCHVRGGKRFDRIAYAQEKGQRMRVYQGIAAGCGHLKCRMWTWSLSPSAW